MIINECRIAKVTKQVHEIEEADRIVQRIGRIGKAKTPLSSLPLDREEEEFEHAKRDYRFGTLIGFCSNE